MIRVHRCFKGSLDVHEGVGGVPIANAPEPAWVEVMAPSPEEVEALRSVLGLHELALEDALAIGHPPKLEDFGTYLFFIAHTPEGDEAGDTRKIAIFLSKSWIVTILRVPLPVSDVVRARVMRDPAYYLGSTAFLAHALLDQMTDGFSRLIDNLGDRVEVLEHDAVKRPDPDLMSSILDLRDDLSRLARIVRGQRDVFHALERSGHIVLPKRILPYLRDLYDHILRVYDQLDSVRDGLLSARDAYLASMNNKLSDVMRMLTVISTIMMPLTLITGIYGMNFAAMPALDHPRGFWGVLGGMGVLAVAMLWFFRRRRWL